MRPPRIALIATGGTIDALGQDRLDLAHYTERRLRLDDDEFLASVPELGDVASIERVGFPRRPSYDLTAADWNHLAATVQTVLASGVDGVVITHGTNTLEETAFFLHLTVDSPKPVVLVGAMRPASGMSSDGPLNLLRAVQVAASDKARGLGVVVVLNDTIHSARHVTKTSTSRVDAFSSLDGGPLGLVAADGSVRIFGVPRSGERRPHFQISHLGEFPRVDVVVSHVGADGALIDAAVAAGARGLVCAGSGAGRQTSLENRSLDRAIESGVLVCQSTRVISGPVLRSPEMLRRGLITSDDLPPWKARILLGLGLTKTSKPQEIQSLFDSI